MQIIRYFNILLTGIITGILAGIWIGLNPAGFSFATYLPIQQKLISDLYHYLPGLQLAALILCVISAWQHKKQRLVFWGFIVASLLLACSILISLIAIHPLYAQMMSWTVTTLPAQWEPLERESWQYQQWQTMAVLLAFCIIVWYSLSEPEIKPA